MKTILSQTEKTKITNSLRGWEGRTSTAETGEGWEIVTIKRASGFITSTAQKVKFLPNGALTYSLFSDARINLLSEKGKATENKIKELHAKALILFDAHPEAVKINEAEPYKIEIGQRVFLDGYGKGQRDGNAIIYAINSTDWGINYLTIDIDTLELSTVSHIRDYKEKFGIGTYYIEGDKFKGSIDDLNNFVIDAKQKEAQEIERAKSSRILEDQLRKAKIEEGKKLVSIPKDAKCVIVADMYQDNSDSQTDYFNTSVSFFVVLAFSSNERNNMQELKKACLNYEETEKFANDSKFEHNDGHSYLPNYYVGSRDWYGWKVNKNKYTINLSTEAGRELVYIAAAEGRYFVPNVAEPEKKSIESLKIGSIEIVDYSEKAIAVIGDTKPIKDQLKELGGRFNFRLSCGAGWIFQKSKQTEIEKLIQGLK
jgi:hypothetical protein